MNSICVNIDEIDVKQLPRRSVRVLTDSLSVGSMTFGVCEVPPHTAMDPHQHVQEEIIWILDGYGKVNVDGRQEQIRPGTLIHFPSNSSHFTVNESDQLMRFTFCFSPPVVVGSYDSNPIPNQEE